jgi:hypothetical protein
MPSPCVSSHLHVLALSLYIYICLSVSRPSYRPKHQGIAMEINESMRDFERDERVLEIQKSLWAVGRVPTIVQPGRRLVHEGKLDKVSRSSGNLQHYTVFLFNDILLYASTSALLAGKYRFHNVMQFYGVARCDPARCPAGVPLDRCLEVTGSSGRLLFVAPSAEHASVWVEKAQEVSYIFYIYFYR